MQAIQVKLYMISIGCKKAFTNIHFMTSNSDNLSFILLPKPESMCELVIEKRMGMRILKELRQQVAVQSARRINFCKKVMDLSKISEKSISPSKNILFHGTPP